MTTRVKICGITRRVDALRAVDLGAAAVGFVFAASARQVAPELARSVCDDLPPYVGRVGVFANQPLAEILDIARAVPLTHVQLHGDEPPAMAAQIPLPVTRAIRFGAVELEREVERWKAVRRDVNVLLDLPKEAGPSQSAALWKRAARLARRQVVTLAGGLDPDNVLRALEEVRPAAVDVARGVESSPGIKDPELLDRFFAAIRAFDFGPGNMRA